MMQLNPTVGVAPGTTTMTLGDPACPPDEPWQYTQPPQVQTGFPSGVTAAGPDGKFPVPHYWVGEAGADLGRAPIRWDPYTDPPQLKGLGQSESPRWSLVLFTGLAAFAVVFGVRYFRRRKK